MEIRPLHAARQTYCEFRQFDWGLRWIFCETLKRGLNLRTLVYVVVESPKGTENKYEYDVQKKAIVLDQRTLFGGSFSWRLRFICLDNARDRDELCR